MGELLVYPSNPFYTWFSFISTSVWLDKEYFDFHKLLHEASWPYLSTLKSSLLIFIKWCCRTITILSLKKLFNFQTKLFSKHSKFFLQLASKQTLPFFWRDLFGHQPCYPSLLLQKFWQYQSMGETKIDYNHLDFQQFLLLPCCCRCKRTYILRV